VSSCRQTCGFGAVKCVGLKNQSIISALIGLTSIKSAKEHVVFMPETIIELNHISKSFVGVQALDDVSLSINKGEIHSIIGENGSGKSTLIKIVSGVYTPDSGEVILNGKTYHKLDPKGAMNAGIQVIFQDFAVFPNLTVAENIAMNTGHNNALTLINWQRIRTVAEQAIKMLNINLNLREEVVNLTVAEKQLVAICRAIISKAQVIIMDEPTTALTRNEVNRLFSIINDLQRKGITIIFVSHKMDEVLEISRNFTVLRNGKKVITGKVEDLNEEKFIQYMTGRNFKPESFTATVNTNEIPALEVKNLGLQRSLENISFKVYKGEILGIAGTLGSGRTELGLALFGYYKMTHGELFLNGKQVVIRNIHDAVRLGIGHVPEDRLTQGLTLHKSIRENIAICKVDTFAKRFNILDTQAMCIDTDMWVKKLSIATSNPENTADTLSGGNQQKVVLAKWLATKLSVLVLNGPTVGVDIGAKYDIHGILKGFARENMATIIISDDISELMMTCSRILVMNRGRITDELIPSQTTDKELIQKMMTDIV
jgi:simple sugar transport system ATP-binding protein